MINDLLLIIWIIIKIAVVVVCLLASVAYLTFIERKVIGYIQGRIGPNRVGFAGLAQPIADVFKLLIKEVIQPTAANRYLYLLAPTLVIAPALAAWAVIPFSEGYALANINAGLLFIFSMTSLGVYGVLIGGWASNSKYAFFGALRASAQTISYEIAMGFALVGVLMASSSMNLQDIVMRQSGGFWHWYWLPLLPLFVVYWISAMAETNRAPFDVSEGESEIVAGFHVEYSGMGFALFFLAEYANMILVSTVASLLFLGGWLSPVQGIPVLGPLLAWVPGFAWLLLKICFFLYMYLWIRATFPRFRYDQIMYLGWKVLIPVTLVWVVLIGFAVQFHLGPWFAS